MNYKKAYQKMKYKLNDYIRCQRIVERHEREAAILRAKINAGSGGGIDYSKPNVVTSPGDGAAYTDWVTDLVSLEQQIVREYIELSEIKIQTLMLIRNITDKDKNDVLRLRYINGWRWEEIGDVMHLSPGRVRHICYEAIEDLVKVSHP